MNYAQFAGMLANPNIEVRVGILSRDTAKFGKDKAASNIFGAKVLIFIGSDSPTIYDPSFAKTFATNRTSIDQVIIPDSQARELALIEFDEAQTFRRDHPLIASLAAALGLDAPAVDTAFRAAAQL